MALQTRELIDKFNPEINDMQEVQEAIIKETLRRIVDECIPRIIHCLENLTEEDVWYHHNDNSNSMGVLILHLCGNVRQWILAGVCGQVDGRQRDLEFNPENKPSKVELIQKLNDLASDLLARLPKIKGNILLEVRKVQCYEETVLSMLIHATEHFSYHTGQIVYFTKYLKDIDTAFYAGQNLSANS